MKYLLSSVYRYWTYLVKLATGSRSPYPIEELTAVSAALACVPEFVIENTCEHLLLIRRFNPVAFEQSGHRLPEIFDLILGITSITSVGETFLQFKIVRKSRDSRFSQIKIMSLSYQKRLNWLSHWTIFQCDWAHSPLLNMSKFYQCFGAGAVTLARLRLHLKYSLNNSCKIYGT